VVRSVNRSGEIARMTMRYCAIALLLGACASPYGKDHYGNDPISGLTVFGGFADPRTVGWPVSSAGWEDSAEISNDGSMLFLTYSPYSAPFFMLKTGPERPGQKRGAFDMFEATPDGGSFAVQNSTANSPRADDWDYAATYADDAATIVWVRKTPEEDNPQLYWATKDGDHWGSPVKLPSPVNTPCIEDNPYLSADATTLYFDSSRRMPAAASGDDCIAETLSIHRTIYRTHLDNGVWSDPQALIGPPNVGDFHLQVFFTPDEGYVYWTGHDHDCNADGCIYRATRQADDSYGDTQLIAQPTSHSHAKQGVDATGVGEPSVTADGRYLYFVYATYYDMIYTDNNIGVAVLP
jgi:hypothetical protein